MTTETIVGGNKRRKYSYFHIQQNDIRRSHMFDAVKLILQKNGKMKGKRCPILTCVQYFYKNVYRSYNLNILFVSAYIYRWYVKIKMTLVNILVCKPHNIDNSKTELDCGKNIGSPCKLTIFFDENQISFQFEESFFDWES